MRRRPHPAWMIIAAVLAAWANFNVVWNHFYAGVPKLFDTGWYAALVYRQTPLLPNPGSVVFNSVGEFFYSTHFSPGLWLLSLPSYLFDPGPVVWLAIVEATKHALLVVVAWAALGCMDRGQGRWSGWERFAAIVIIFLAPFGGVMLAGSAYTHFELWFVPGALAFLMLLFRQRHGWAALAMGATVLIREDMGFHLCGLLLVAAVVAAWDRRKLDSEVRSWLGFAVAGFIWSSLALLMMGRFFPGGGVFTRIYLGEPPFAHLTASIIKYRLGYLFEYRAYIWVPLVLYGIWALLARRVWMLIGYVAFIPWFVLNFVAFQHVAATFSLYYSFPFALAILWPLAGMLAFDRAPAVARPRLSWVAAGLALSLLGFVQGSEWRSLGRDMLVPRLARQESIDSAVTLLVDAIDRGERVGVGAAVAAFEAKGFEAYNLFGQTPDEVDRVALFTNGEQVQIGWETAGSLPFHYRVESTPIVLVSRDPLGGEFLYLVSDHPETVLPFLEPNGPDFSWIDDDSVEDWRLICSGPEWFLPGPDPWEARFVVSIDAAAEAGEAVVICEVVVDGGNRTLASERIAVESANSGQAPLARSLRFELPPRISGGIQFRVWAADGTNGRIEDVRLRRLENASPENQSI